MGMPTYDAKLVWRETVAYGTVPAIEEVVYDSLTGWYSHDAGDPRPLPPAPGEFVKEEVVLLFDAGSEIVGLGRIKALPPCPIGATPNALSNERRELSR